MMNFRRGLTKAQALEGFVGTFSAGPDKTVIQTNLTLTATVVGDLTGHTTLWERIDGPSASVGTPNNLSTPIVLSTIGPDYTFRFWIDKGTPFELYDDVKVFTTIKSEVNQRIHATGASINLLTKAITGINLNISDTVEQGVTQSIQAGISRIESGIVHEVLSDEGESGIMASALTLDTSFAPNAVRRYTKQDELESGILASRLVATYDFTPAN